MMSRVSERIDRERARAEVSRWIYPHPSEGPLVHEPFFIVGVVRTFGVSWWSCVYCYQGMCSLIGYVCRVYVGGWWWCVRAFVRAFVRTRRRPWTTRSRASIGASSTPWTRRGRASDCPTTVRAFDLVRDGRITRWIRCDFDLIRRETRGRSRDDGVERADAD